MVCRWAEGAKLYLCQNCGLMAWLSFSACREMQLDQLAKLKFGCTSLCPLHGMRWPLTSTAIHCSIAPQECPPQKS